MCVEVSVRERERGRERERACLHAWTCMLDCPLFLPDVAIMPGMCCSLQRDVLQSPVRCRDLSGLSYPQSLDTVRTCYMSDYSANNHASSDEPSKVSFFKRKGLVQRRRPKALKATLW